VATYKLIQDIEAEDKILGPLTLRQFIFGLIAVLFGYLSVLSILKHLPFFLVILLPPTLFFGIFAFPFGRDQPTEIWLLAKIRFWFFPRKRIWDQSGVKELVTITVPKKVERVLTDGLTQSEVKNRLQVLANTIDSRGWAIKNMHAYVQPVMPTVSSDDRLIDISDLPQEVPDTDATTANDMLDPITNPLAHQVDEMVRQSEQAHRQQIYNQLNAPEAASPAEPTSSGGWFMGQAGNSAQTNRASQSYAQPVAPSPASPVDTASEAELSNQLKKQSHSQEVAYGHLRTLQPLNSTHVPRAKHFLAPKAKRVLPPVQKQGTTISNPAILGLAGNDDLNISTLSRVANKADGEAKHSSDEVIIPLR